MPSRSLPTGPLVVLLTTLLAVPVLAAETTEPVDPTDFETRYRLLRENADDQSDAERLEALYQLAFEEVMHQSPEFGTFIGYPVGEDRWTDQSWEAIQRRKAEQEWPLQVLDTIDRSTLEGEDRLNHDLFRRFVVEGLEGRRFQDELLPIDSRGGPQQGPAQLLSAMPVRNTAQARNVVGRLEKLPAVIDQNLDLMKRGLAAGIMPAAPTLEGVGDQIRAMITDDAMTSPLLRPLVELPDSIPAEEQESLRADAVRAYEEGIRPAYERLLAYFESTYRPAARTDIALSSLPDGQAWYAYRVKQFTTTELTPQEIHDIGLAEVKRIRGEMEAVIASTGFEGSFSDFTEFLRTDPQFFFETPEELLRAYRDIAKRADAALPTLFGTLPRLPYGVEPVPDYSEKDQTTAYYEPGSLEVGRPGIFRANTYDLSSRPSWEMEALTLHEAVPGHHLQIALSAEQEEVPMFRRWSFVTAFIEGWGLYAESLGEEMGFYEDPYAKFGQLTYEMWRAIRLVVDTGMHSLGWSRQQAIDLFLANTGKSLHDIEVEVDRYIGTPAQALAYKIGELKLKELRARASDALGDDFDVRAFHDRVLGSGALPLDVLEQHVAEWVAAEKASSGEVPTVSATGTP